MAATASTSTTAVAQELVTMCRAGRYVDAVNKLYYPKIVSVEPVAMENMPAEMTRIDAVRGKNEWWIANNEVHSDEANGPFVGQDQFAVQYTFDVTFKATGKRTRMTEMALSTVKDGKIVREQFFYNGQAPEAYGVRALGWTGTTMMRSVCRSGPTWKSAVPTSLNPHFV